MMLFCYVSLFFLLIAQGFIFLKKREVRRVKKYFFFVVSAFFLFLVYLSYLQYQLWINDDLAKFLLPPYQEFSYFLFYSFMRFFSPFLISFLASLLFIFLLRFFNKKYQERFFFEEEIYFGAIAVFLVGYPGFIFYMILMLLLGIILTALKKERASLFYFWIPVAIFVIIISNWLTQWPIWMALKV